MAWVKNGKIYKIVTGMSETNFQKNLNAHKLRGWKVVGELKYDRQGISCMVVNERKV